MAGVFVTGMLSPVSADSSTVSWYASSTRASAGTRLPGPRKITSPGTISSIGKSTLCPPRSTLTSGASSRVSEAMVRSAVVSVT